MWRSSAWMIAWKVLVNTNPAKTTADNRDTAACTASSARCRLKHPGVAQAGRHAFTNLNE